MKYLKPLDDTTSDPNVSYHDGSEALGILGSVPPGAAFEAVQREIVKVITMAGLTPDKDDLTQLYQAIGVLIGAKTRTRLSADTTFYVSNSGSDSTGKGTSVAPWKTIAYAWSTIVNTYDLNGFTATIQLAAGTYTSGASYFLPSNGSLVIDGVSAGSASIVTTGNAIGAIGPGSLTLKNLSIGVTNGNGLVSDIGARVFLSNVTFTGATGTSPAGGAAVFVLRGAQVAVITTITLTGTFTYGVFTTLCGVFSLNGGTITFTSATFTSVTTAAYFNSVQDWSGTITGTATGQRFNASSGAVINTSGGGANAIPGSVAGVGTNFAASPYGLYQ